MAVSALPALGNSSAAQRTGIPSRTVGNRKGTIPAIGIDGLACAKGDMDRSRTLIASALENGFTFFDSSTSHIEGRSERRMGEILGTHRRDSIFLQSRCLARTKRVAHTELNLSLARLRTDYLDSYLIDSEIPGRTDEQLEYPNLDIFEAMIEARKAGKTRIIGIRAPMNTKHLQQMLELYGSEVDVVMVPYKLPDDNEALRKARRIGAGVILDVNKDAQKAWLKGPASKSPLPDYATSWVIPVSNPKEIAKLAGLARSLPQPSQ